MTGAANQTSWIIPSDRVHPGAPSHMRGSIEMYYAIHVAAICLLTSSFLASLLVMRHISGGHVPKWVDHQLYNVFSLREASISTMSSSTRQSFASRLVFCLALTDTLWSTSHLVDHLILLVSGTFPSKLSGTILGCNVWLWFGYQQAIHASLCVFAYLKVCHGITLKLGRHDWRLHAICGLAVVLPVPILLSENGFGMSGYFSFSNLETRSGHGLLVIGCLFAAFNTFATIQGYRAIMANLRRRHHPPRNSHTTKNANGQDQADELRFRSSDLLKGVVSTDVGTNISFHPSTNGPSVHGSASTSAHGVAVPCPTPKSIASSPRRMSPALAPYNTLRQSASTSRTDSSSNAAPHSDSGPGAGPFPTPEKRGSTHNQGQRPGRSRAMSRSELAIRSLGILMRTAAYMYVPLTIATCATAFTMAMFGVIEPASQMLLVVSANCSGILNGYAYMKIELAKREAADSSMVGEGGEDHEWE